MCLAGLNVPYDSFTVAASRLGNFENPVWCFSATPFYPLPSLESVSSDLQAFKYRIVWSPVNLYFSPFPDSHSHFICETF